MNEKVIVAVSGGFDSYVLMKDLLVKEYDVYPVYIKYSTEQSNDLSYLKRQLIQLKNHTNLKKLNVVEAKVINQDPNREVTGRNIFMLSILTMKAGEIGAKYISMGIHPNIFWAGDELSMTAYNDQQIEFYNKTKELLKETYNIGFLAPFIWLPKTSIIQLSREYGLKDEDSTSCNKNIAESCLKCTTCIDRLLNFWLLELDDNASKHRMEYKELKTKMLVKGAASILEENAIGKSLTKEEIEKMKKLYGTFKAFGGL